MTQESRTLPLTSPAHLSARIRVFVSSWRRKVLRSPRKSLFCSASSRSSRSSFHAVQRQQTRLRWRQRRSRSPECRPRRRNRQRCAVGCCSDCADICTASSRMVLETAQVRCWPSQTADDQSGLVLPRRLPGRSFASSRVHLPKCSSTACDGQRRHVDAILVRYLRARRRSGRQERRRAGPAEERQCDTGARQCRGRRRSTERGA